MFIGRNYYTWMNASQINNEYKKDVEEFSLFVQ